MLLIRILLLKETVLSTQTINYSSEAIAPPNPTRMGYTFANRSEEYTNITADKIIIAQYSINQYITFDTNGRSDVTSIK